MNITINTAAAAQTSAANFGTLNGVSKTEETSTEETTEVTAVQTRKYDTVELSEEAEQYLSEDTAAIGNTEEAETASLIAEAYSESNEEEDMVNDLSTYSDSELEQLLRNGDITQLEYNNEMASRAGSAEE